NFEGGQWILEGDIRPILPQARFPYPHAYKATSGFNMSSTAGHWTTNIFRYDTLIKIDNAHGSASFSTGMTSSTSWDVAR
ncbi:hypothetical protein FA15DRAFT_675622, partial [Coprinopsis marcescibilis]